MSMLCSGMRSAAPLGAARGPARRAATLQQGTFNV